MTVGSELAEWLRRAADVFAVDSGRHQQVSKGYRSPRDGCASRLLKNPVVSWSGWDSEGIRENKDESPGPSVKLRNRNGVPQK
jgi:hypothetical protein